jgi:hypothetical protein
VSKAHKDLLASLNISDELGNVFDVSNLIKHPLYGPRHGGANEAVLRMLDQIGDVKNIPQFVADVKARKKVLMGFGHRVYKNYDPRAKIVK